MDPVPDFEVTRRATSHGIVVAPRGEIDLATVDDVRAEVDEARHERDVVILDLRAVTFIDSAGVRLIVEAARDLQRQDGELFVVRGGPEITRVFELVGLEGRVRMLDEPLGE